MSGVRIDGSPLQGVGQGKGGSEDSEEVGSYRGLEVTQETDALSLLADMAEEMTFAASEHEEKNIEDRKPVREERGVRRAEFAIARLEDLDRQDLEQFLQSLRGKSLEKLGELKGRLALLFKDPLHRHAALRRASEELAEDAELSGTLDTLLAELEAEHGPEIRAGYNIADVPAEGLKGGKTELRALYVETILDYRSLSNAMQKLVDRYGPEEFPAAVAGLFKAVSADCSAAAPSTDPARLKTLMDDMYQLELLGNTYKDCAALLDKVRGDYPPAPGASLAGARPEDIMRPVLHLNDAATVQAAQVRNLMPFLHGNQDPVCDVHLTQGVKALVRKMPHRVFDSQDKRQNLLDAIQDVVDEAVEREETRKE